MLMACLYHGRVVLYSHHPWNSVKSTNTIRLDIFFNLGWITNRSSNQPKNSLDGAFSFAGGKFPLPLWLYLCWERSGGWNRLEWFEDWQRTNLQQASSTFKTTEPHPSPLAFPTSLPATPVGHLKKRSSGWNQSGSRWALQTRYCCKGLAGA